MGGSPSEVKLETLNIQQFTTRVFAEAFLIQPFTTRVPVGLL